MKNRNTLALGLVRALVGALAAAVLAPALAPAQAHDLWIELDASGRLALWRGHRHSIHEGAETMPIDPQHILAVLCVDADGSVTEGGCQAGNDGLGWTIACDALAAHVTLSSGYWTKTVYGTKNVPRRQAQHAVTSWQSFETVTYLRRWHPRLAQALGERLEILPSEDPASWHEGHKATFQVTLAGRPMPGVIVSYQGKPRGTTGEDGRINIRLRESGFQMIQASLSRPSTDPDADEVIDTATLNFRLEEGP